MTTTIETSETTELQPLPVSFGGETWPLFLQQGSKEFLVRDLDVAAWLGYERPHDIRELINRHGPALGEVFRTVRKTSEAGGRPGMDNYLTERQVLILIAKSETARAYALLGTMVDVFLLARKGLLVPSDRKMAEAMTAFLEARDAIEQFAALRSEHAELLQHRTKDLARLEKLEQQLFELQQELGKMRRGVEMLSTEETQQTPKNQQRIVKAMLSLGWELAGTTFRKIEAEA